MEINKMPSLRHSILLVFAACFLASFLPGSVAEAQSKYPESLQNWVDGGKHVKFEGLDIFVHTSGTAPVKGHGVLVVHGYPGSSWDFSNVVAKVEKKTKIVVPDMIGFGQSDKPLKGTFKDNFSLMRQADLYEAIAETEGLEEVILLAHDMGQSVGLELMTRQFEGKLSFKDTVRIDGEFTGEITSENTLIVGETGEITATIRSNIVVVSGSVSGNIYAGRQVVLHKTARVEGDLECTSIMIEEGALFNGHLNMHAGGPAAQKLKSVEGGSSGAPKPVEGGDKKNSG